MDKFSVQLTSYLVDAMRMILINFFKQFFVSTCADNESWRIAAGSIGGLSIVIVIYRIVRKLRRMNRPNPQVEEENQRILHEQGTLNSFSSTSEPNELTLRRASSSGRTSTSSSTNNDILAKKEDPSDSKNKSSAKGQHWGCTPVRC